MATVDHVDPVTQIGRVLVIGDSHGELDWLTAAFEVAQRNGCRRVLQLGDFGLWPDPMVGADEGGPVINRGWLEAVAERAAEHDVWLRFIDGNHDFHQGARDVYAVDDNGIRTISSGLLDWADRGATWEWDGVRFGALGGAVSVDRAERVPDWSYWADTEPTTEGDLDALAGRSPSGVDVLITHDAPMFPPGIREIGEEPLDTECAINRGLMAEACNRFTPSMLIHGHYHLRHSAILTTPTGVDVRVEGFASNFEAHIPDASWAVLDLSTLTLSDAD